MFFYFRRAHYNERTHMSLCQVWELFLLQLPVMHVLILTSVPATPVPIPCLTTELFPYSHSLSLLPFLSFSRSYYPGNFLLLFAFLQITVPNNAVSWTAQQKTPCSAMTWEVQLQGNFKSIPESRAE